ncbi:Predicted enzyme related to lactoylglutathione lyase [Legionella lansingensis]|uniref:Glyoxalase-like domain protein n=1 Tax=Legionella lansingensis TaxID=45067 RepID=A0A0W0VEC1_9GAMM|nr:VOC family protein [Legionella lansingensis]KTD18492.1 Glyoxalase-like domain protein [Legionella lansingensis]SNV50120.1 Predicted enzyme related to lactoylglutathione lyase [Legionella lansingensis]
MTKNVFYLPEGYATITPYLIVKNAAKAIEFYKAVFGAKELMCMPGPNNSVGHAELTIGESKFMLADECPDMDAKAPSAYGGSPVGIHLYVKDVDAIVNQAIKHGAKLTQNVEDRFYGDRNGTIEDPFGHKWHISTHIEDVSEEEVMKRMQEGM